nr:MAG TPA: hypothetical protein [Inoviridae sp.]
MQGVSPKIGDTVFTLVQTLTNQDKQPPWGVRGI